VWQRSRTPRLPAKNKDGFKGSKIWPTFLGRLPPEPELLGDAGQSYTNRCDHEQKHWATLITSKQMRQQVWQRWIPPTRSYRNHSLLTDPQGPTSKADPLYWRLKGSAMGNYWRYWSGLQNKVSNLGNSKLGIEKILRLWCYSLVWSWKIQKNISDLLFLGWDQCEKIDRSDQYIDWNSTKNKRWTHVITAPMAGCQKSGIEEMWGKQYINVWNKCEEDGTFFHLRNRFLRFSSSIGKKRKCGSRLFLGTPIRVICHIGTAKEAGRCSRNEEEKKPNVKG